MKNKLNLKAAALVVALLISQPVFAGQTTEGGYTPPVNNGSMGGAANSAKEAGSSQGMAQMASMMMAAMLASQCGPQNQAACIMSGLAAAQGASLGGTKKGSEASQNAFSTGGGAGAVTDPYKTGSAGASTISPDIKNKLAEKGAKISADGKTMTLPDGKTVPLSAGNSEAGMRAAGLSEMDIAAGRAALADAQAAVKDKIKAYNPTVDGGGGGGGGGGAGRETGGGSANGFNFAMPKQPRGKPSLSGMTKNLGNDKIGVSADNIFDMVTRRYKESDAKQTFLKN
jgi:hypothetical protein